MITPNKGDFIALTDDINPMYKYIPLEIVGLQHVPDWVAVKVIGTNKIFPINLSESTYEVLHSDYVNAFKSQNIQPQREMMYPPQFAFGFMPDNQEF